MNDQSIGEMRQEIILFREYVLADTDKIVSALDKARQNAQLVFPLLELILELDTIFNIKSGAIIYKFNKFRADTEQFVKEIGEFIAPIFIGDSIASIDKEWQQTIVVLEQAKQWRKESLALIENNWQFYPSEVATFLKKYQPDNLGNVM